MKKLFALSLLCAALTSVSARAQMRDISMIKRDTTKYCTIEGVVLETGTNEPLPGAAVRILDTEMRTKTDLDGRFQFIRVPSGVCSIQTRMTGYNHGPVCALLMQPGEKLIIRMKLEVDTSAQKYSQKYRESMWWKQGYKVRNATGSEYIWFK
jgi:hypothetical protein